MVHLTFWQPLTMPIFAGKLDGKRTRTDPHTLDISGKIRFVAIIPYGHTFSTHALASGVDAKTLAGILGHTKASFTLDTYTHTTGDMQQRAADIVGRFLTDYLGEETTLCQNGENAATAESA